MNNSIINITENTDLDVIINALNAKESENILNEPNLKFPDEVYDNLPRPIDSLKDEIGQPQKRDIALITILTVLSGITKKYYVQHADNKEGTQIYTYILGNPAQGKGFAGKFKGVGDKFHKFLTNKYEREYGKYLKDKKTFDNDPDAEVEPIRPPRNFLFIPGNITKSAFYSELADNDGYALIFETEADTLVSAISNTYGDHSDVLRKGWHGEPISKILQQTRVQGATEIDHVNISMLITSTLNQCFSLIPTGENGLFSRFIFYILQPYSAFKNPYGSSSNSKLDHYIDFIADTFLEIGKEENNRDHKIEFMYTGEQKLGYLEFFKKIDKHFSEEYSNKLGSNINRFGLIFTRIAMLLTYLRNYEEGGYQDRKMVICSEADFNTTCIIVEKLLHHLKITYHLYMNQNKSQKDLAYIPDQIGRDEKKIRAELRKIKSLELLSNGNSYREVSKEVFGNENHAGTIHKWSKKKNMGAFPFPETETASFSRKEINVQEVFEATQVSVFENVFSQDA